MRKRQSEVLKPVLSEEGEAVPAQLTEPSHVGLAYERWVPERAAQGRDAGWNAWLAWLAKARAPHGYEVAYARWRGSLEETPGSCCVEVEALSRLLVGHGNPSGTEVGLALHHTWGVPVIPGSALKGLTAAWVDAMYGVEEPPRAGTGDSLRGLRWDEQGQRVLRGPGEAYRWLFGAPEVEGASAEQAAASQGQVLFHDALWVPRVAEGSRTGEPMLARDVLTVHQKRYYGEGGSQGHWPNDYDEPNPVSFLSVRPGGRFLVALSLAPRACDEGQAALEWTLQVLLQALEHWGVGGKTSAGYGRLRAQ